MHLISSEGLQKLSQACQSIWSLLFCPHASPPPERKPISHFQQPRKRSVVSHDGFSDFGFVWFFFNCALVCSTIVYFLTVFEYWIVL